MSNQCTVKADVAELARQVIADVDAAASAGAPIVHCQLLASRFYDELRRKFRETPERELRAAIARCERATGVLISPAKLLAELNVAAVLLERHEPRPVVTGRPQLHVIQGGLA
jgi:hypothetical protein